MSSHLPRRLATILTTVLVAALSLSTSAGSVSAAGTVSSAGSVNTAQSATTLSTGTGTDAMAIAVDPTSSSGSVAFDTTRGDSVSASIVLPLGSLPERLFMTARTPTPGSQPSANVWISHSETLVVGQNDAAGLLDVYTSGAGCSVSSGTITIAELTRDATGLASFSGSFDAVCPTGEPIRGALRWHSALPYTALALTSQVVAAGAVEVGQTGVTQVTVTNVGNEPAAVWPPSFTGSTAGDWSAAASSTCNSGSALAPAATCTMDVAFAPSAGDQRLAAMRVPSPQGPGAYDISLSGVGVGQPTPPTDLQANGSVFGTVLTWGLPANSGGSMSESATIEKTTDGGVSWSTLTTITGVSVDLRTYPDGLGVAPGAEVGYRVSTTQKKVAPGQTRTYSSAPSAVAVATGARQSLVIDGISAYDRRRPISLRGSMNPDVPTPGFFLPSTDSGPWDQSPDGSEIVMASVGAGTTALPYELRRRPALGRTVASTSVYAGAYPISDVAWSPDGSTLAWREYHRDNSQSYLMVGSAAGGSVRGLNLTNFWGFQWLPDSRTLVGISAQSATGASATFVDTRTGVLTPTTAPAVNIGLSPDARRLVATTTDANLRNEFFDIYTLDPASRSLSAPVRTQKPYLGISHVEFSPDGRELMTSERYQFSRWPLTSGNAVLDTGPSTQTGELSSVRWHTYRPTLAPSPATTGATASFTIQAGRMAPGTTFQCAVDDRALAGCSSSWTTPALAPGRHTARVIGTEPGGRSGTAARTWVVITPTLYTAITPKRVMDTRIGLGAAKAKIAAGGRVTLTIPGLPAGTTAATLNVTATNATAGSYLTAYPAGATQPTASNLNFVVGQTVANLIVVPVSGGKVTFYNAAGTVDVIADLAGYYTPTAGTRFIPQPPDRILDTRIGLGASKATAGPGTVTLVVPGLPAGTTAVALNVTVARPTATSYLTVYPSGKARPTASNLNFVKGQTTANMVIVPVGTGGKISFYNNAGTVDIVADIAGAYTPKTGAYFTALTPARVLDTRNGIGAPTAKVGPGLEVTLALPYLPDGVTAVALSVTATKPTASSYLTVYPAGQQIPWVSNINFLAGQTVPNLVIVGVGPNNTVTFRNGSGSVDVLADLAGYFRP